MASKKILDTNSSALIAGVCELVTLQFLKGELLDNVELGLKRDRQSHRLGIHFFIWEDELRLALQVTGMPTNKDNQRLTNEAAKLLKLKPLVHNGRAYSHILQVASLVS